MLTQYQPSELYCHRILQKKFNDFQILPMYRLDYKKNTLVQQDFSFNTKRIILKKHIP